jgi:hypothetical protein
MPMGSTRSFESSLQDIGLKRGKMELLTSLMGYRSLQAHSERQRKNLEAEDLAGRTALGWGSDPATSDDGVDMGDTILGDVNHPAPVAVPQAIGILAPLTMALLGASIPGAAIGGYLLNRHLNSEIPVPAVSSEDESVRLSLPDPEH